MDLESNFGKLHKLFDDNFIEYSSYVIIHDALPICTIALLYDFSLNPQILF